jgi:hypothetical protein
MVKDRAVSAQDTEHSSEEGRGSVLLRRDRFVAVSAHDGGEVVRAAQGVSAFGYPVLNPGPLVLADRGGQLSRQAEFGCVAIDAGQAFWLRNVQPAMRAWVGMSLDARAGEAKGAFLVPCGNAQDVLVGVERAYLPGDCNDGVPPGEVI